MKSLYLVISDIHVSETNSEEVKTRLLELTGWIDRKCTTEDYQDVVILVSGDIAFSGKK